MWLMKKLDHCKFLAWRFQLLNHFVYNDKPRDTKIVALADRWLLFRGYLCNESSKWDLKMMVVIDGGF
jgi:hypothetical protein